MLNRRGFVKGLFGASVALPVLESVDRLVGRTPGLALGQTMPARAGFAVFVRAGNGVQCALSDRGEPERFWPASAFGPITTAGLRSGGNEQRAITELADYAPKLNILRGVRRPFGTPRCGHAESIPQCLTAAQCTQGVANEPLSQGISVDWRIARALNRAGVEPLTLMAGPRSAYIAEGLSWRDVRVRNPAQRSPLAAYMAVMGVAAMPPAVQQRIAQARMSVNDLVRGEMNQLLGNARLGRADQQRLRQHLEAIRDTELRLTCTGDAMLDARVRAITSPEGNDVRPEVVRRHMDVIALTFSCGLNHAATLQVGEGNDQTIYNIGGTNLPRFHWISHRIAGDGGDGSAPAIAGADMMHHQVDRLQLQMFKYLLDRLSAYPSASGRAGSNLLDDTVAVWLNDLGSGPPHSGDNVPWILAGSAAGGLRTGSYVDTGRATINKVLNTILTGVGVRNASGGAVDDFGDSGLERGALTGLLAV